MLITTKPSGRLKEICCQWNRGDSLHELVGCQLFGTISSVSFDDPEDIYLSTSTSIVLEDCALMLWIQQQTDEQITVGCQWAGDYQCGAFALAKGILKEFTVSTEAIMDLQKALLLENTDASEIDELREQGNSEEEIDEILWQWSDDYRVEARDGLQIAFLRSVHEGNSNLTDYAYFKMLSDLDCDWQINDLHDMGESAGQLLKPINYDDPEYIDSIFVQQSDEFWKLHRDRIHGILSNLPEELKNRKELFKQIIPNVAAWILEYAGPEVRSDKDILRLAIEADETHNYAPSALEYAAEEVFEDREFLEEVLTRQKGEYYNLPQTLRTDRKFLKIVLKQGLGLPEEVSTDRELIEIYAASGNRFVYSHIPPDLASDLELAKIYIRHGGDWWGLPDTLKASRDTLINYLTYYDFDQDDGLPTFDLERALESHLRIDDWDTATLTPDFVIACLDVTPRFFCMLNYNHLTLSEWDQLVKQYNSLAYASRLLQLKLALTLKSELNDSILFDQLNKLTDIDSEDPQVVEAIQQAKMGMMELELAILEMEKTPENVEALRSTLNELTEGFEDQDEST
jgi:hypothetical protein